MAGDRETSLSSIHMEQTPECHEDIRSQKACKCHRKVPPHSLPNCFLTSGGSWGGKGNRKRDTEQRAR